MRTGLILILAINTFCVQAQVKSEFTIGILQSTDKNKWDLVSSSSQGVGVSAPVNLRFATVGIRARAAVLKPLSETFRVIFQTGVNLRRGEVLWAEKRHTYLSLPLQAGISYRLLNKQFFTLCLNAYSGINIFYLEDKYSRRQTGFLHNAEVSYALNQEGFFKSFVFKAGYESEVDNETFFYKASALFFKDENFHYKVKRNQIYIAVGLGI